MIIPAGTRIRLLAMSDDPDPLPIGTTGTVQSCTELSGWTQIQVRWDIHRHLSLCVPPDQFEIIKS